MDNGADFDVHSKCVHRIKGCRHCHIIPLLSGTQDIVSYFVEHRTKGGQCIKCTIGKRGIRPRSFEDKLEDAQRRLFAIPENGEVFLDAIQELEDEGNGDSSTSYETPAPLLEIDLTLEDLRDKVSVLQEPVNTEHIKSTSGSQFDQVKKQMEDVFSATLIRKSTKCIEQFIFLVVGLQFDTNLEAIVLRCVTFLSGITEGGIVMSLKDKLMEYVAQAELPSLYKGTEFKQIYEAEKSVNEPEMLSPETLAVWETMRQGIFTKHLSYILGTVFAFSTCHIKNVKFSHPIYEKIVEASKAEEIDGVDLIDHVIKLYNWTSTVGMACLEARSLEPLTINSKTLSKCHEKLYYWRAKFDAMKRSGKSTQHERRIMYVEVETVLHKLQQFVKTQRDKFTTLNSANIFQQVEALFSDVREFVMKVDRVKVAAGFHVVGVPKAGKSTIIPMIHEQVCLARGEAYRPENNAQINFSSKFQDSLENSTQCITVNETLPTKEHLAKSVEEAYNISLAVMDTVPYHPNRSELSEKVKVTLQHISVVSSGNKDQPFINVARTPGAWERRYTIIKMKVKDEYADRFGRIDSSKCDGSNDYHLFDMYDIVYQDREKVICPYKFDGKDVINFNTRMIFEVIRKKCIQHFREQDALFECQDNQEPGCLNCQRLSYLCVCPNKETHTTADLSLGHTVASVYTDNTENGVCPKAPEICGRRPYCKYKADFCIYCESPDPNVLAPDKPDEEFMDAVRELQKQDLAGEFACSLLEKRHNFIPEPTDPEMGVTGTLASAAISIGWSSIQPWVNPFFKMKYLWNIDNNLFQCAHEEIVEEVANLPDKFLTTGLSLLPRRWTERDDGTLTFFGRKKESFLRMVAAERQIFLPITLLLRRALIFGAMYFLLALIMLGALEHFGLNPRAYESIDTVQRTEWEWDRWYLYPEYSQHVMSRRDYWLERGIVTENYLDWKKYYVDIYSFQKFLGELYIPWFFERVYYVDILVPKLVEWWIFPSVFAAFVAIFMFLYMLFRRWAGYEKRVQNLIDCAKSNPALQRECYDRSRRHVTEYNTIVPTAVGVVGCIITGISIWNTIRQRPEFGEIDRSTKPPFWDSWLSSSKKSALPDTTKDFHARDMEQRIENALVSVETELNGAKRFVIGVFTRPGVMKLPRHLFKPDPFKDELVDYLDLRCVHRNAKFKLRAYKGNLERIGNKDAVLLKVFKAPKITKSIDEFLPKCTGNDHSKCKLIYLKDGEAQKEELLAKYIDNVDCGGYDCGRGLEYTSVNTKKGFCGSVLISDRKNGAILGFHISGAANGITSASRTGFAQEITSAEYKEALSRLEKQVTYIATPEMTDLCTNRLGQELIPEKGPHPKTKMFDKGEMDEYNSFEVLGHDKNLPKYRSRVRRSILSEAIQKHCNMENRWKSPYMKHPWVHHNKNLLVAAKGADEAPPESVRWAVDDFKDQLLPRLKDHIAQYPDFCRKLTIDEAINGVAGSYYMGEFKMNTSAGIPSTTKEASGLFERIDPYPDGRKRYKLSEVAEEYYNDLLKTMESGQYHGIWVRSCLKDEVVEIESEKVRIFYILECLFGLMCRQYFLPVAEFLSRNPLTSECMVGVNCAGPEWEQMMNHLTELSPDGRVTDWDYSKYDIRRSADVMCASLKIMIWICEQMGYSQDSLKIMEGLAEELRNPIVNWNGTIIWMYIWCSGNSMTVYGNSIENSLHQRISFHWNGTRLLGDDFYKLGPFRDNERILTYGDDGGSGCKPELRDICGFSAKCKYFDFVGMKITDARKSDNPAETVSIDEFDFLKRRSVYHPALGCNVGALKVDSIWKMGHMTSGSGADEDLAIAAMQSMMAEAFLHGQDFYETLRSQLSCCARDVGIWTDVLERTYETKIVDWKEKYQS